MPKGTKTALMEIQAAIHEFEKEHGMSYWKAATLIAMKLAKENGNTTLLCKIMDKFVPSKIEAMADETPTSLPFTVRLNGISGN